MAMTIGQNIQEVEKRISLACQRAGRSPNEVKVVAVTKTIEVPAIHAAFDAGIKDFGENRVQEASRKIEGLRNLRPGFTWHMVGHLQRNKVKTATEIFDIIQSVDSLSLAESLNACSQERLQILIQVNVAAEVTKGGFCPSEIEEMADKIGRLPNLEILGLMTIAPWTSDIEEVRPVFRKLRELRDALKLRQLSMGMSDDFEVAIEEGSTLVRIGRAIFGERKLT